SNVHELRPVRYFAFLRDLAKGDALLLEDATGDLATYVVTQTDVVDRTRSEVLADHGDDRLTLEVEDNGCGIDDEDRPHLFNPFFTRKSSGTGLGLTQVKKIIEQHGGEIEVRSKKGEGTCFVITLPRDAR
ncbi:MAG TPA: ATP-binding protein, partial [Deltaproteobacteria bacterium]|nr:ATP-binding protein [Deltaproteobacteria bacterium]